MNLINWSDQDLSTYRYPENQQDTEDKRFVVIDHTWQLEESLREALKNRNDNEVIHTTSGEKVAPAFLVEFANLVKYAFKN